MKLKKFGIDVLMITSHVLSYVVLHLVELVKTNTKYRNLIIEIGCKIEGVYGGKQAEDKAR